MPHYRVRLAIPGEPGMAWTTRITVKPRQHLTDPELEQQARTQALRAFGEQARTWWLLDAERRTR